MKRRIGIITFHSVTNYGAVLQCYGLYAAIKELEPEAEVEIINYQPLRAIKAYLRSNVRKARNFLYFVKTGKFRAFRSASMKSSGVPLYTRRGLRRLSDKYDCVIAGSDEIWRLGGMRGHDPSYFLDFCGANTRRISYAASVSSKANPSGYDITRPLLAKFHAISVRDRFSADFIRAYTDKPVAEVVDPTLLSDFSRFTRPKPKGETPYILLYGHLDGGDFDALREFADREGMRIFCVGGAQKGADVSLVNAGPVEWLGLFAGASLVVTQFFHGLMFALKFEKPLVMIRHAGKEAKVDGFAEKVGILNALVDLPLSVGKIDAVRDGIDYPTVREKLRNLREDSLAFLKEALS